MTSPSVELQAAIVARLASVTVVTDMIADRVYDGVPESAVLPYVSFGPVDEVDDGAECIDALEITLQLDVWTDPVGSIAAKRIADAIRRALHGHDFNLTDNASVSFEHRLTRIFRDPDGLRTHAPMTFTALVETS